MNKKAEAILSDANYDWDKQIKKLSNKEYSKETKEKLEKMVVKYLKRAKKNP